MLSNFFSKNLYFFFIIFVTFLILLFLTDFLIRDIVIHNLLDWKNFGYNYRGWERGKIIHRIAG